MPSCFSRSAFTLTEILVVIGIIVLLLVLAVPAFSWLTGSNSIAGAENTLSAALGRARASAIGLQRTTGVFFFIDRASQRVTVAQVYAVDGNPGPAQELLELEEDQDFVVLPPGVLLQTVNNNPTNTTDDRYIGFNTGMASGGDSIVQFGGVILFDASGRLVSRSYGFSQFEAGSTTVVSDINNLLHDIAREGGGASANMIPENTKGLMRSAFGVAIFERDPFLTNGAIEDEQAGGTEDTAEETWLDANATPLLINRYNGTLVRSE